MLNHRAAHGNLHLGCREWGKGRGRAAPVRLDATPAVADDGDRSVREPLYFGQAATQKGASTMSESFFGPDPGVGTESLRLPEELQEPVR